MRMTGPFTSQIPLLVGIEILTIVAFVLSAIALLGGNTTTPLAHSAIIIFNTTSLDAALPATTTDTSIPDWYTVSYLSVCSGNWNHAPLDGDDRMATSYIHHNSGFAFSLLRELPSRAAHLFENNPSYGTLSTKTPFILLTIGVALAGISLIFMAYSIIFLSATSKTPLLTLRIAYLAMIPTVPIFTISAAKITSIAGKIVGSKTLSEGVTVSAWMGWEFYVITWLGVGFICGAMGLSVFVAFRIAAALKVQNEIEREKLKRSGRVKGEY